ncbi:hypothetical protein [Roseibium sp.]|uniref:hypothetical protein n=1 Tax=Roseibium sp. TaxID=1936156 RepID=UPI00329A59FA
MSFKAQPSTSKARAWRVVQETLASLARHAKDAETKGLIQEAADIRAVFTALKAEAVLIAPHKHHAAPSADPAKV